MKSLSNLAKLIGCATLLSASLQTGIALADNSPQTHKESVGTYFDGTVVTTKIKAKIAANKHLKNTDISVTTENDTVILTGTVKTDGQKDEAEKVAKLVDGVKTVDNQLVVTK